MSDYQIGAFEALKWVWHMLREYDDDPSGIEDARATIREMVFKLSKGDKIQFKDKVSKPLIAKELQLIRNL